MMGYRFPLLFAVVIAFSGLLLFRKSQLPSPHQQSHHDGTFKKIAGNLSRQGYLWHVPFADRKVELYVFLLQYGADFLLIDAGPPGEEYADFLLKGLKKEIGTGQLRLVVLTHGHIDHVGGLPALKQAYPDAHVAFHTEESPYLTGEALYKDVPSDHDEYDLITHDVSAALPQSRVLHLKDEDMLLQLPANERRVAALHAGSSGDVADAVSLTGRSPKWLPPRGALQYHHMPGHAPGQVVYLHTPLGSLVAGDTFTNTGQPPALGFPPPRVTPNVTRARLSAKALAALQFETAFCTHDSATGVSKPELQKWTQSF